MSNLSFKPGIFKEELKNRFLCLVEVDGEDTLCYIPSSCRLSNFVNLTGKIVLLSPIVSANSRTKYSVYALSVGDEFILLNMSKANKAVESNISSRYFSFLGKRNNVKKEHKIEGYKSDLYVEDTKTIVEIKSILSFNSKVQFPSIYSQRAIDQLAKLGGLLERGYKVCYIFVSLNPRVKQITLSDTIIKYRDEFNHCIEKGMKVKGVTIKLINGEPVVHTSLKIQVS